MKLCLFLSAIIKICFFFTAYSGIFISQIKFNDSFEMIFLIMFIFFNYVYFITKNAVNNVSV